MKNRLLGSVLMIAGTTVGAAVLALPLVTAKLGFLLAAILLISCWGIMLLAAFLILHINLAFENNANFSTMASKTLGLKGKIITWFSFLMLLYAMTAAYITGGGDLLQNTLYKLLHISTDVRLCNILFAVTLGSFVCLGTLAVDWINRLLISIKILVFLIAAFFLFPHINLKNLWILNFAEHDWLKALPIIISSFCFHIIIPSLREYLHSDIKKLKKAIFIGSLIPLLIYLLWEIVILGVIPLNGENSFASLLSSESSVPGMINLLQMLLANPKISWSMNILADIAITTSFLGVSMSLMHFIRDGFQFNFQFILHRILAALFTFFPPLIFAWFYPEGFLLALNYATSFILILLIIIPILMYFQLKKIKLKSAFSFHLSQMTGFLLIIFSLFVIYIELFY